MSCLSRKHERTETEYELQLVHWQPARKRQRGSGPHRGSALRTLASLHPPPSLHLILGISAHPQPFPLLMLPRDLLLLIADLLDLKSHSLLSRTCWYLTVHLQHHLFTRDNKINHYPAMYHACREGKSLVLERALYYGVPPDLNTAIRGGMTSLAVSARSSNICGVRCLLENGADVNASGITGLTPLAYALAVLSRGIRGLSTRSSVDLIRIIEAILEAGADPTCDLGLGALSKRGTVTALTEVLDMCYDFDYVSRRHGLDQAAAVRLARILVLKGAKTDGRGRRNRRSPLQWAVAKGLRSFADLLLAHGADIDYGLRDGIRDTALGEAISRNNVVMIEYLASRGANLNPSPVNTGIRSPLVMAVICANSDTLAALLRLGASPDLVETARTPRPRGPPFTGTALSEAVYYQSSPRATLPAMPLAKIQLILSADADPNLSDLMGRRPLTGALTVSTVGDRSIIVRELLRHGADPNLPDENQVSPLALCINRAWKENPERELVRETRTQIARALIAAGADVNTCGPGMPYTWPLLEALSRNEMCHYGDEANDYLKVTGLYNRKLLETNAAARAEDVSGAGVAPPSDPAVTLADVPEEGWNNPLVPILLNAGAKVWQGLLDRVIY